jgi:hypothetical protein
MAVISIDPHFKKDHQQAKKVRIRNEGKIKACGTICPDWPRFRCLHIGLAAAFPVPPLRDQTRERRAEPPSALTFCSASTVR